MCIHNDHVSSTLKYTKNEITKLHFEFIFWCIKYKGKFATCYSLGRADM